MRFPRRWHASLTKSEPLGEIDWNAERAIALGNARHIDGVEFTDGTVPV